MKFFTVIVAALATVALAAPADDTKAATSQVSDESAALKFLLSNSPANHQASEDGPAPPGCYWDGTSPFCAGSCPTGYTEDRGSCGDGACCWTGYKVLCCRDSD